MTSAYKYIQETIQKMYKARAAPFRSRIVTWNKDPVFNRVERPTNLTRARTLGYKAKNGYIIVRTRIDKGRRKRRHMMGGRKSRHRYLYVQAQLSHQAIAEQRVNRVYKNMEVLNSYYVGEDGNNKFFEVILVDPTKVEITAANNKGRAFRGLTSVGKKARGLGRGKLGSRTQRVKD
jgi:large subunit ribosomal protein L15e